MGDKKYTLTSLKSPQCRGKNRQTDKQTKVQYWGVNQTNSSRGPVVGNSALKAQARPQVLDNDNDCGKWLLTMTVTRTKLTDKGPIINIFYIVIIKFCCSLYTKLPGKKLIHFIQKITTYIEINWSLILMYVMVKIEAISYCLCFDKSFYVSIQLFLRVYNTVTHNQ